MNTENLDNIWEDFKNGSLEAYKELAIFFANSLFSYGYCFIKDDDLVKECITNVFFDIWINKKQIEPTTNAKAYIFKAFRLLLLEMQVHLKGLKTLDNLCEFTMEFEVEKNTLDVSTKVWVKKLENNLTASQMEFLYLRICENIEKSMIMDIMDRKTEVNFSFYENTPEQLFDH